MVRQLIAWPQILTRDVRHSIMFPLLRQMECTLQEQYFTPCMYDDYERENVNVDNCHNNHNNNNNTFVYDSIINEKKVHENVNKKSNNNNNMIDDSELLIDVMDQQTTLGHENNVRNGTNGVLANNVKNKQSFNVLGKNKHNKMKSAGKPCYKHVPHRDKPPHLVERRNARERRRVQAVNSAFARLRKSVPLENRNKRVSKVKTLQKAIEYINYLQDVLHDDNKTRLPCNNNRLNKENGNSTSANRWMCI